MQTIDVDMMTLWAEHEVKGRTGFEVQVFEKSCCTIIVSVKKTDSAQAVGVKCAPCSPLGST